MLIKDDINSKSFLIYSKSDISSTQSKKCYTEYSHYINNKHKFSEKNNEFLPTKNSTYALSLNTGIFTEKENLNTENKENLKMYFNNLINFSSYPYVKKHIKKSNVPKHIISNIYTKYSNNINKIILIQKNIRKFLVRNIIVDIFILKNMIENFVKIIKNAIIYGIFNKILNLKKYNRIRYIDSLQSLNIAKGSDTDLEELNMNLGKNKENINPNILSNTEDIVETLVDNLENTMLTNEEKDIIETFRKSKINNHKKKLSSFSNKNLSSLEGYYSKKSTCFNTRKCDTVNNTRISNCIPKCRNHSINGSYNNDKINMANNSTNIYKNTYSNEVNDLINNIHIENIIRENELIQKTYYMHNTDGNTIKRDTNVYPLLTFSSNDNASNNNINVNNSNSAFNPVELESLEVIRIPEEKYNRNNKVFNRINDNNEDIKLIYSLEDINTPAYFNNNELEKSTLKEVPNMINFAEPDVINNEIKHLSNILPFNDNNNEITLKTIIKPLSQNISDNKQNNSEINPTETIYEIKTPSKGWKVMRKTKDFERLREILIENYPEIDIPSLILEKNYGLNDSALIYVNAELIQKFMDDILINDILYKSDIVISFLSISEQNKFEKSMKELLVNYNKNTENFVTLTEFDNNNNNNINDEYNNNIKNYFIVKKEIVNKLSNK